MRIRSVFAAINLCMAWQTADAFTATSFQRCRIYQTSSTILYQSSNDDNSFFQEFLQRFQGDFDNYHQVVRDRQNGMEPREGGGHEHIHCTLIPLFEDKIMAAFYFDGMPQRIFRFRLYELYPYKNKIDMKLYTLHPELEGEIRQKYTQDPMEWPRVYQEFVKEHAITSPIKELTRCDVQWSRDEDPNQHTYMNDIADKDAIHAVMIYGEALVESTMIPGQHIRIVDQLSLWKNEFWIHDRAFDPDTGDFIYGNQRDVPYQMQRVTNIKGEERQVMNAELKWTLGPKWRTEEEYLVNMERIGGVSTRLNS